MISKSLRQQIKDTTSTFTEKKIEITGKKSRLNLNLPQEIRDKWDLLAKSKGVSLTKMLMYAMDNLEKSLEKDYIEVSAIGIIYKK